MTVRDADPIAEIRARVEMHRVAWSASPRIDPHQDEYVLLAEVDRLRAENAALRDQLQAKEEER